MILHQNTVHIPCTRDALQHTINSNNHILIAYMERFFIYMCTMQHVWKNGLNWNGCFAQIDIYPCSKREVKISEKIQMFNTTIKDWMWHSTAAIHQHTESMWSVRLILILVYVCVCVFVLQTRIVILHHISKLTFATKWIVKLYFGHIYCDLDHNFCCFSFCCHCVAVNVLCVLLFEENICVHGICPLFRK